jgi:hypothetical protein
MHVGVDGDLATEVRLLVRSPGTMTRGTSRMPSSGLVS